jgi:hypothetical protein
MSNSALASSGPEQTRAPLGVNVSTSLLAAAGIVAGATLIGAIVNPKQAAL